jgi:histidine triad (HIT) family protein
VENKPLFPAAFFLFLFFYLTANIFSLITIINDKEGLMGDCVFCKLISGEFKTEFLYKDEYVACFKDIKPATPAHFLVVPVKHIPTPADIKDADREIIGRMFQAAAKVAEQLGVDKSGYRAALNTGPDAGQEVMHMHLHVLGGRKFGWPPG